MRVRAIDFVVVNVSDLERSGAFYRDTLGMDFPLWEDSERWKEFDSPPVALALRLDKESPGVNAAVALEELRGKGVEILSDVGESAVCHTALIEDPDGNLLLLHQRKDGTAG
jgi:catechol 2,3-dioxygenase-like lactoylglutathione lyase family enzyme